MSDRDTFGPRLRSERERRGISIETIVTVTKVGADLWLGLERNDFSKWPSGIFARAFVRDYAKAVGLDADDIVDEFCRLFPQGDRRAARIIKAQAEIIGHKPGSLEDPALVPRQGDRRVSVQERKAQARAPSAQDGATNGRGRYRRVLHYLPRVDRPRGRRRRFLGLDRRCRPRVLQLVDHSHRRVTWHPSRGPHAAADAGAFRGPRARACVSHC